MLSKALKPYSSGVCFLEAQKWRDVGFDLVTLMYVDYELNNLDVGEMKPQAQSAKELCERTGPEYFAPCFETGLREELNYSTAAGNAKTHP